VVKPITQTRMSKTLPLHEVHQAASATFTDLFGWQVVQRFSSVEAEYWALHKTAGWIDLSCSGIFEVKGDDRTRFLHGMLTNDIKSLAPGCGCYAASLSPQGRLVGDLRVFCCEESLLLTTEPAVREKLGPALRKYIIGDRPVLLDRSEELAILSLQGPRATALLAKVFPEVASLEKPYSHQAADLAGARVRICHVCRTGWGGYDFIVERPMLRLVWNLILQDGKQEGAEPVGFEGLNVHRVEAGIPWYGLDMDESTLPIEAGLEKSAISFNKGCYVGQESVARITYRGHVNRKLVGLRLSGSRPASQGNKIWRDSQEVGWVTSSVHSWRLGAAIALAYLRREVLDAAAPVSIDAGEGSIDARVVPLPFLDIPPATA